MNVSAYGVMTKDIGCRVLAVKLNLRLLHLTVPNIIQNKTKEKLDLGLTNRILIIR